MQKYLFGLALTLAFPCSSWAAAWSTCQTVTSVSDSIAYAGVVQVVISPGIAGCTDNGVSVVNFRVGEQGVTADSVKGYLATALAAFLAEKRVMILYDGSTSSCNSNILSVGGYAAQCP